MKQLGRGISETTVANGDDVDAVLVVKIRAGEEPEIDVFESMKVVEQLSLAEVDDVVPDGDTFKVTPPGPGRHYGPFAEDAFG